MMNVNPNETRIIYHIDDEDTPYAVKLPIALNEIRLRDFKSVLSIPRPNYKYFFKSHDDDFGVVKEEIIDDDAKLPIFKGRVVAWLVTADGSNVSDTNSQCTEMSSQIGRHHGHPGHERLGVSIGDSRPPSFHPDHCDDSTCTESESVISSRRGPRHRYHHKNRTPEHHHHHNHHNHRNHCRYDDSSSMMTSDIDTTSFLDSDDDDDDDDEITSRISTTTDETSISKINDKRHRRRRKRHRMPIMSRTSSISSITESTMSLNIITVTLNLDTINFLGISIVGQSNRSGSDGGIYVGSIMKGGAVALDGRIEPGDMILQVNDVNFENMSNDDAVRVLREAAAKPGPIKLVVAKCWDQNPKGYFTIPRTEPVRPIDPGAWVAHTEAARANQLGAPEFPLRPPSVSTVTSTSSSITSSIPESDRQLIMDPAQLSIEMDMLTIAKAMANPDSGLDVKDRVWLKVVIPKAFLGSDVVDWLFCHVSGFQDRREAKKYAAQMNKSGYIKNTVNKSSFSEQCYYVFGEILICNSLAALKVGSDDNSHSHDLLHNASTDSPTPRSIPGQLPGYPGGQFMQHPTVPFWSSGCQGDSEWNNYGMFGANPLRYEGSVHSGSGASANHRNDVTLIGERQAASPGASSEPDQISQRSGPIMIQQHHLNHNANMNQMNNPQANGNPDGNQIHHHNQLMNGNTDLTDSNHSGGSSNSNQSMTNTSTATRDTVTGHLNTVSSDIGGSRQSFRMAMGNPCECFVDVM